MLVLNQFAESGFCNAKTPFFKKFGLYSWSQYNKFPSTFGLLEPKCGFVSSERYFLFQLVTKRHPPLFFWCHLPPKDPISSVTLVTRRPHAPRCLMTLIRHPHIEVSPGCSLFILVLLVNPSSNMQSKIID